MPLRLRLLLLVALIAGAAAAFSVAAAQPADAARRDTIIIRPVEAASEPVPPIVDQPALVLSPQPDISEEWVVTQSGRFQTLPEDASPAAVDAAVADELVAADPEGAAVDGVLARHGVDAIFPVATPDAAAAQGESAAVTDRHGGGATVDGTTGAGNQPSTAAGALKLQAPDDREVARQRAADARPHARGAAATSRPPAPALQSAANASKQSRPPAKTAAKKTVASNAKAAKQRRTTAVKTPTRSKDRAADAKQRGQARAAKASARRQAHIRTATSRVKRGLHAAAQRRRARIPAPPVIDVPVTEVRGIAVHRRIAGRTAALLAAADRANLRLNGWGYRSTQRQIQLRRQHCGKSRYAMYRMPSSRCWPATAPPGKSMHERGLAIDFYVEGRKGRALPIAGTREFRWLKRNAARYGFFNLPSEAWHWSTNGR